MHIHCVLSLSRISFCAVVFCNLFVCVGVLVVLVKLSVLAK